MAKAKNILWFSEVTKDDIALVGGKGANLGELTRAGLPVPQGFIVTAQAYYYFLKKTDVQRKINKLLNHLDPEDSKKLNFIAKEIKKAILESKMPEDLKKEITDAYHKLGGFPVAVRSSATAEDLPEASFAGQQATYLNTEGVEDVVKNVQRCYASLYEARAIYYRIVNKFDHMKVGLAVPVQNMIESEASGIMFTVDPVSSDLTKMVIEAGYGLGEAIVSGSVTPDRYLIDKKTMEIVDKEINRQNWKIVHKSGGGDKHVTVARKLQKAQKISDSLILDIAKIGQKIEEHYGKPQDTEWALERGKVYMVQSRPVTTLGKGTINQDQAQPTSQESKPTSEVSTKGQSISTAKLLLKGAAASLGMASGPVKIIHKPSEIDLVAKGDILVTEMTTPDFVPAMRRAAGIVTDTGGRTCHAAIVSREMGIPCVVGTGTATSKLKTGQVITVDGSSGSVYLGAVAVDEKQVEMNHQPSVSATVGERVEEVPITGTKVYVNLGEPELAAEIAKQPVDGIGLLRAEFMIAEIGEHPRAMVEDGRADEYVNKLAEGLTTFCQAFNPRPVVYRATDFKTNEYRNLKGGAKYEPAENNPMIGYRGASRYIKEPDLFKLEIEAIKKVRNSGLKNLHLMIPFTRTVDEFRKVKALVNEFGLIQSQDFKLWMMCEVPSNVILLEKFLALGIDGISIGSNDLTQLTLGADRDNQVLAEIFDERDEAVLMSIQYVIKTCRKHNVTCSICGQAPSVYPEITEFMVKNGVTSVSVTPDMILQTRKVIASVEKRLLLQNIIDR
jgi:pyruvate,water dikinase